MKILSVLMLLLIGCIGANAQDTAELYQAEIIVFRQIEADTAIDKLRDLNHPQTNRHAERAALDLFQTNAYDDIQVVAKDQLKLTDEAQKIRLDSRYELLYHVGWRQPPLDRAQAPYINILNGPQNGLLKATAWISFERLFRLILDFQYDPTFNETPQFVDIPKTFSIPIHLERIMADEKLFYIDHPIIGVIAVINPIS